MIHIVRPFTVQCLLLKPDDSTGQCRALLPPSVCLQEHVLTPHGHSGGIFFLCFVGS